MYGSYSSQTAEGCAVSFRKTTGFSLAVEKLTPTILNARKKRTVEKIFKNVETIYITTFA